MITQQLPGITRITKESRVETIAAFFHHRDTRRYISRRRVYMDGNYQSCPIGHALNLDYEKEAPKLKKVMPWTWIAPPIVPGPFQAAEALGIQSSRQNGRRFEIFMNLVDSDNLRLRDALMAFAVDYDELPDAEALS